MLKVDVKKPDFYIPAIIIFIISVIIKSFFIGDYSLWYDESVSLFNAQKNLLRVLEYSALDNTPPVYNLFLYLWIKIFGVSEFSVRFPSTIFSALTAVGLYYLGIRYKSLLTGIVAVCVFTFNNFNLWYAQEARCYALVALFAVVSLIVFDNWLREASLRNTKWLIVVNTLLLYTHYITFFIFAAQVVYILLYRKELFKSYFKLMLKVAMYFAIWSIALIRNLININRGFWIPPTSANTLEVFLKEIAGSLQQFYFLAATISVAFFFQRENKKNYIYIALSVVLPIGLLLLVSLVTPLFISRYLIYIFPFIALLLGLAAHSTKSFFFNVFTSVLIVLAMAYNVNVYQDKGEDMKSLVEKVKSVQTENTTIVLQTASFFGLFTYYYDRKGLFENTDEIFTLLKERNILRLSRIDQLDKEIVDTADQVILINMFNEYPDPESKVRKYIQKNHPTEGCIEKYGGLTLRVYSKN